MITVQEGSGSLTSASTLWTERTRLSTRSGGQRRRAGIGINIISRDRAGEWLRQKA
jgi:hypothetical protein